MSTIHVFFTHDGRRYVAGVEETPWEAPTSPVADTWTTFTFGDIVVRLRVSPTELGRPLSSNPNSRIIGVRPGFSETRSSPLSSAVGNGSGERLLRSLGNMLSIINTQARTEVQRTVVEWQRRGTGHSHVLESLNTGAAARSEM